MATTDNISLISARDQAGEPAKVPNALWISAGLIALSSLMTGYSFSSLNSCLVFGNKNSADACFDHDDDGGCPPGTIYDDLNLTNCKLLKTHIEQKFIFIQSIDSLNVHAASCYDVILLKILMICPLLVICIVDDRIYIYIVETSMATSILLLGAWITSMYGSSPSEQYGRKATLLYNNVLYIAGALMTASGLMPLLYVGRLVTGFAVGLTSVVAPVLLSEIASPATRGSITTLHQLAIVAGILVASLVAYGFVTYLANGWQYVQAFPIIPATIMILLSAMIPESPKWLIAKKNDIDGAIGVLKRLRAHDENVVEEAEEMRVSTQHDSVEEATWSELWAWRHAVGIGSALMFFQAMTGINSVIFYSTTIFGFAGVSEAILATASVGVVNLFATLLAANLVDVYGRKTLILTGSCIMFGALMLLSMVLWFGNELGGSTQGGIAVLGVLIFVFGFAVGLGAACWVIFSELVPTRLRTKAFGVFMSVNFAFNIVIGM